MQIYQPNRKPSNQENHSKGASPFFEITIRINEIKQRLPEVWYRFADPVRHVMSISDAASQHTCLRSSADCI